MPLIHCNMSTIKRVFNKVITKGCLKKEKSFGLGVNLIINHCFRELYVSIKGELIAV